MRTFLLRSPSRWQARSITWEQITSITTCCTGLLRSWTDDDAEVWVAMVRERAAGRTRLLGVSNVSLRHLEQMTAFGSEAPAFVQNRCFARDGWRCSSVLQPKKARVSSLLAAHCEPGGAAPPGVGAHFHAPQGHARLGGVPLRACGRHASAHRHFQCRAHEGGSRQPRPIAFRGRGADDRVLG